MWNTDSHPFPLMMHIDLSEHASALRTKRKNTSDNTSHWPVHFTLRWVTQSNEMKTFPYYTHYTQVKVIYNSKISPWIQLVEQRSKSTVIFLIICQSVHYAAFTCYQNYLKYEFPSLKLDMNALSSCIYHWETRGSFWYPSWVGHEL